MWLLISLGWVCVGSLGVIWLCLLFDCFVCRVIVRFRCGLICLLGTCGLYCGWFLVLWVLCDYGFGFVWLSAL